MFTRAAGRCRQPVAPPRAFRRRAPERGARHAARAFAPPTVSETKARFLAEYDRPVPAMYETVLQELLVQQHFLRYNKKYQYDEIFALGLVSVFDQILDEMPGGESGAVFNAYITSLGEKPEQYKKDAAALTELATAASGAEELKPDGDGTELQKLLARVAAKASTGEFFYSRFFAIGVFRLLELTETRDPKALEALVKGLGVKPESVNKDLLLYKSILSKMTAAKELMAEFLEREKRKQGERDAEKASKASGNGESASPTDGARGDIPEGAKASS